MDGNQFDDLSRKLARLQSRRSLLKTGLGAAVIGGALAGQQGAAARGDAFRFALQGGPNEDCPAGTTLLTKFENFNSVTVGQQFSSLGVTITITTVKTVGDVISSNFGDAGEPISFTFTSIAPISSVIVKSGQDAQTHLFNPAVLAGGPLTTPASNPQGIPQGISNIQFCIGTPTTTTTAAPTTTTTTTAPPTTTTTTTSPPTTTTTTTQPPTTTTTTTQPPTTTTTTTTTDPPTTTTTTTSPPTTTDPPTTTTTTTDPPTTTTTTTARPTTTTTTTDPPRTTTTTTTKQPPKTTTTTTTKGPVTLPSTGVGSAGQDSANAGPVLALLGAAAVLGRSLVRRVRRVE